MPAALSTWVRQAMMEMQMAAPYSSTQEGKGREDLRGAQHARDDVIFYHGL